MQITSNTFSAHNTSEFYKATTGGIQKCLVVDNSNGVGASERTWGYVVDSLYIPLVNSNCFFHFDHPNQGFFTEESEAIEFHRELVLNYINGLNNSTLKTCPIVIG